MATPYIPPSLSAFSLWLSNFSDKLTAAPATYGLEPADAVIVDDARVDFADAYQISSDPATRTTASIAATAAMRASAEAIVRPYAQRIKVNPAVSNFSRSTIGVTINSFPPTPIPAPTTSPVVMLQTAANLTHRLQYRDSESPTTKSKPYGVKGMALFATIGVAPAVDPDAARYIGSFTKSPLQVEFQSADRGKICTYFARWENGSGPGGVAAKGPWAAPVSIVIL